MCNSPTTGLCFHNAIALITLNFEQNAIKFPWLLLFPSPDLDLTSFAAFLLFAECSEGHI